MSVFEIRVGAYGLFAFGTDAEKERGDGAAFGVCYGVYGTSGGGLDVSSPVIGIVASRGEGRAGKRGGVVVRTFGG